MLWNILCHQRLVEFTSSSLEYSLNSSRIPSGVSLSPLRFDERVGDSLGSLTWLQFYAITFGSNVRWFCSKSNRIFKQPIKWLLITYEEGGRRGGEMISSQSSIQTWLGEAHHFQRLRLILCFPLPDPWFAPSSVFFVSDDDWSNLPEHNLRTNIRKLFWWTECKSMAP